MSKILNKILFIVCFTVAVGPTLIAQVNSDNIRPQFNSPISRFGLGNLTNSYFTVPGSMGGYSAAYIDPYHLNMANPASLSFMQATAFEVGLNTQVTQLNGSNGGSDNFLNGNLNYLALGFPIKNPLNQALDRVNSPWQFGMAIGLSPYSNVGYDISTTGGDEETGSLVNVLKGKGGTYRLNWGTSARYKGLSVGVNLGYHFGQIINSRLVAFDTLEYSYFTEFRDDMSINGFVWNAGLQYVYEFKSINDKGENVYNGKRIILGAFGNSKQNFNTTSTHFVTRDNPFSSFSIVDTIAYDTDIEGAGVLPSELTFGIAYEQANKVKLGVEYSFGKWSQYENEAKQDKLSDTWRLSVGGEYIPNAISYNNYFQRIRYRAGFYTGTDSRSIQSEQLKYSALTLGFGLPIIMSRQRVSFIDLGFEFGQSGVKDILTENYFKFTLGLTLNDNSWFFKRKFN
jgi:hypothetical protein